MVIAPSEQVRVSLSPMASRNTPSKIGSVERGDRAWVAMDSPLFRSVTWQLKRIFLGLLQAVVLK